MSGFEYLSATQIRLPMKKSLLALLFLTGSASAQWTSDPSLNTIVHDDAGLEEVVPLTTPGDNGSTIISWFAANSSGNYDFKMQKLDVDGYGQWGATGKFISTYPQNSALFRYDLTSDLFGNSVVAFQDMRLGILSVFAYRLGANGTLGWNANGIPCFDSLSTGGIAPDVAIAPGSGNAFVAWNADDGNDRWISIQCIAPNGSFIWGNTPLRIKDSTGVVNYSRPQVVPMAGTDDFLVFYVQETGNFPFTSTMFVQRYTAAGVAVWSNAVQVSTKTIPWVHYPSVIRDDADGLYIGFNTSNPVMSTMNDVYVQHIDANGNLWNATGFEASTSTTTHKELVALRANMAPGVHWLLMKELDSNQGQAGVTVQKFDNTGTMLLGANGASVTPISATYDEPWDMQEVTNGYIIAYANGSFGNQELRAIRIDDNGATVWPSHVVMSNVASSKGDGSMLRFHSNNVVVVWDDERQDRGVYAQNIDIDGNLGVLTAIEASTQTPELQVAPIPLTTASNILLPQNSKLEQRLELFDMLGRPLGMLSVPATRQFVSIRELLSGDLPSSGTFLLRYTSGSVSIMRKLIR